MIRIGTSGWHYRHWVGDFYPQCCPTDKMFSLYASAFDTVEINNSFYRLPDEKTFQRWKDMAPEGFLFAVKASRFITHIKKLKDVAGAVSLFFDRAKPLGTKLGPILFQLPPNWKVDLGRLHGFLDVLPKVHRYALEVRDQSWCTEPVYELLRQYDIAFCLHDWRNVSWPRVLTSDFTYVRFHGSGQRYEGNYSDAHLLRWRDLIRSWSQQLNAIYVYFNNDIGGHAVRNAQSLRGILGLASRTQQFNPA